MADTRSNVTTSIRITVAVIVSLILAVFILVWEGGVFNFGISLWYGPYVILPLLSLVWSFGSNCLIQYLSCKSVAWLTQFYHALVVPAVLYVLWLILYFIPGLRWPIEGLAQQADPDMRKGLSSGFYTFWVSMYAQGVFNSMAQICLS